MKVDASKNPPQHWGDGTPLFNRSRGLSEREAELAVLLFVDEVLAREITLKKFLVEEVFPDVQVEILPHEVKLIAVKLFANGPGREDYVKLLSKLNLLGYTKKEVDRIVKLATSSRQNGLQLRRALGYTGV